MRSMLAGLAETGSETAKRLEGFASVRSTLAGVAETGSETAQRLEGFASVRSTLAGVAETGCKKTIPHRLRRSSLYTREPKNSPITEVSFAYFSFQRKVWGRAKKSDKNCKRRLTKAGKYDILLWQKEEKRSPLSPSRTASLVNNIRFSLRCGGIFGAEKLFGFPQFLFLEVCYYRH